MTSHIDYGFSVEPKGASPSLFKQVHGNAIAELKLPLGALAEADGAWTRDPELALHTFTADCIPLLFFGEGSHDPIAAVHCGWRGAKLGIGRRAVEMLSPMTRTLHVAIGPAILACCFEVKQDFVDDFSRAGRDVTPYLDPRDGKTYCDLLRFVKEQELAALPAARIHDADVRCTYCSQPGLPSYRRDGGTDPRLRSWIRRL